MAKAFISDAEMSKLEASQPKKKFISDEEMSVLEAEQPQEDSGFDIRSPISSSFKQGLKNLQAVGEFVDKYTGAPTRAGLLAGIKGENPLTAAKEQFGEDPTKAPSGEQILGEIGMEPSFARSAAGFGVDVLADPLNLVPAGKLSGLLGKGAKALEEAPKALKALSEEKAIKQAGGMLKDFRRLIGKERIPEVGQALLKETVQVADDAGKIKNVPLMKVGDDVEAIAEKSGLLKKQTGEKIGQIYKDIDNKVTDINFLKTLPAEDFKKIATAERFDPKISAQELSKTIAEKYGKKIDGEKAVARVNEILDQVSKRGNTLEDALSLKGELDELVNYSKQTQELPIVQQAIIDIRNAIRDKTNNYVEKVADILDIKNGKELKKLNKLYGNVAEIEKMSVDRVARNAANRMVSPSDYYVGGTGAGVGGIAGGIPGAIAGAGLGYGNKLLREYGPGLIAKGSAAASKGLTPVANIGASALRGVREFDRPVVRGLLKKPKKKEE